MMATPDVLLVGAGLVDEQRALQEAGLTHAVVGNCLSAILHLELEPSRLVVLSSRLFDGRDDAAVRALRGTTGHPQVLLTLPSDRPRPTDAQKALDVAGFLPEPYTAEDLVSRVRQLLPGRETTKRPVAKATASDWPAEFGRLNEAVEDLSVLVVRVADLLRRQSEARGVMIWFATGPDGALVLHTSSDTRRGGLPPEAHLEREPASLALATSAPAADGAFLAVPLLSEGELLGLVLLEDAERRGGFTVADAAPLAPVLTPTIRAVRTALRIHHLAPLSPVDEVTGLYNQRFFCEWLTREFKRAKRHDRPLSVALFEVGLIAACGPERASRMLMHLGALLQAEFRSTDIVCRLGGEEFAAILPETRRGGPGEAGPLEDEDAEEPAGGAFDVLDRLRLRVGELLLGGNPSLAPSSVTITFGVAGYPGDAEDGDGLRAAAAAALGAARILGGNRGEVPQKS